MRGGSLGSIRQLADQPAQNIILYEPRRWQLQDNSNICTSGVRSTPIQGGVYSQIVNVKCHQKRLVTAGGCGKDGLGLREKERNMVSSHLLVGFCVIISCIFQFTILKLYKCTVHQVYKNYFTTIQI
ncbi:hypothetical protein SS50377_22747 [Spironucleus salmonicida]|nr:hypothetical protein SS50377_22747 [Spironucleus salmonicida]